MSYCGVRTHHQNGHVKKLIRDLQGHVRTVLLHAQQRWMDAINENLWPYAFILCYEIRKWTPRSSDSKMASTRLLDSVWAMRRKIRLTMGNIYKYKVRLNGYGGPSTWHPLLGYLCTCCYMVYNMFDADSCVAA